MAVTDGSQEFVLNSYLTYLIPVTTDFKLEQALKATGEPPKAFFESIEDRESLFFGRCPTYGCVFKVHLLM